MTKEESDNFSKVSLEESVKEQGRKVQRQKVKKGKD
jgi:hypothetical protein